MILYAWNSQGGKWDDLWTNWVYPALATYPRDDVMGMLVESGWPPYIRDGSVTDNQEYFYPTQKAATIDTTRAGASQLCQGIDADSGRLSYWVPWVYNVDKNTNTRCSMGGVWVRQTGRAVRVERFNFTKKLRPTIRVMVGKTTGVELTILQVHFPSGVPNFALKQFNELAAAVPKMISPGAPALILGDLNMDFPSMGLTFSKPWRVLRTSQATQKSGGELDWGVLYDPNAQLVDATANFVVGPNTPTNTSDHAVIRYELPLG